ncbi:MAG: thioredoxin [Clostridia bacterium]|nr:thioredoxin [Clostridia bacterium]
MHVNQIFLNISRQNYPAEVEGSAKPVLLCFWANWCPPCQTVLSRLDGLADDLSKSVKLCLVDVDQEPEIVTDLGVTSIPTLVLLCDGTTKTSIQGIKTKRDLRHLITVALH